MQWLQYPNQRDIANLNNVRRETNRRFRKKKKEYFKPEIGELETNSKIKCIRDLCRGITDFKKGYQPRTNIVKDEKGDFVYRPPTVFWLGEGTISRSSSLFMCLVTVGRQKYAQCNH